MIDWSINWYQLDSYDINYDSYDSLKFDILAYI